MLDMTGLDDGFPVDIISNQLFANSMYFEGFDRSQFPNFYLFL